MITLALERHRAPEPRRTYLVALALACGLCALLAVQTVTARHETRAAEQRACAAELRMLIAKTNLRPVVSDPCLAVKGGRG